MDAEPAGMALFQRQRQIWIGGRGRIEGPAIVGDLGDDRSSRDIEPSRDRIRRCMLLMAWLITLTTSSSIARVSLNMMSSASPSAAQQVPIHPISRAIS